MNNLIGQSLGRYRILEQLGKGGMAIVYKAYDTRLERDVAIKLIRQDAFPPNQLERILKRFEREAKALAKLSHSNIVRVLDYGEHEGSPYLVMEYLPGGSLKQRLGKPISWQEAIRLLIPIANALEYAHEHHVIHRDIKPSNILLTEKGQSMLTDFGIAKILEVKETTSLTASGAGVGTPEYMAPEQWTGETSPQSDIYSLGIVFYEMITGRKPYEADTPAGILLKQATEPLPLPKVYVPSLPDGVEKLILKALARKASDRYIDSTALIRALEKLLNGKDSGKRDLVSGRERRVQVDDTADEFQTRTQVDTVHRTSTRVPVLSAKSSAFLRRGTWALVVLFLIFGGYYFYASPNRSHETSTPSVEPNTPGSTSTLYPTNTPYPTYTPYPISPQFSQADGQIAFVTYRSDGNSDIYFINADGSGQIHLVEGRDPQWSPDGSKIAFTTSDGIYLMNADGSGQTRLNNGFNPQWSPDGSRIAFTAGNMLNQDTRIYIMDADGSMTTQLADGFGPIWSPDGRRIAYSSNLYPYEIYLMNPDGSGKTRLGSEGQNLAWSPDGTRIAFVYRDFNGIRVINVDGSGEMELTGCGFDVQPAWSPDSQLVAFSSVTTIGKTLCMMSADGSGEPRRLAENNNSDPIFPDPAWSPDGRWIAFISQRDGNPEIYVMNADGTGEIRLTNNTTDDRSPVWRP